MSLLRSAALLGRVAAVAGPGLPAQLGALSALQHNLAGSLNQNGHAPWLQARGLSAQSGGSGSSGGAGDQQPQQQPTSEQQSAAGGAAGGSERSAPQQPAEQSAATQQGDARHAQADVQQAAQQAPDPASEDAASAEAAGGASSQQPPSNSNVEQDPRLAKFVEGLKQLKESSTVQRQTIGGDTPWWLALLSSWVGPRVQNWIADFVKAKVEQQFDAEEFLEGAADAFTVVNELIAEGDWDALRPMMSAKMFKALKDTDDAYRADGLVWRTELAGEPKAGIRGMGFMIKQQIATYDEEIAKLAPDDLPTSVPSGSWLVLTVQYKCEQRTIITRAEDGQIVAELKDLRPQSWKFATGPLPLGLPVSRLETEWWLLTI